MRHIRLPVLLRIVVRGVDGVHDGTSLFQSEVVQFISKSTPWQVALDGEPGNEQRSKVRAHLLCFPRASTTCSSSELAEEFLCFCPSIGASGLLRIFVSCVSCDLFVLCRGSLGHVSAIPCRHVAVADYPKLSTISRFPSSHMYVEELFK